MVICFVPLLVFAKSEGYEFAHSNFINSAFLFSEITALPRVRRR